MNNSVSRFCYRQCNHFNMLKENKKDPLKGNSKPYGNNIRQLLDLIQLTVLSVANIRF